MSFIITLLAAVFVFSAVIAIHEFGHFAVAKLCGVQVNEFSIGMGPVLLKKTQNGTQYSLRALPVGGFVALEGEESPESQQAEKGERPDAEPQTPPSCADADGSPDGGAGNEEAPAQPVGKPLNEAAVWQRALIMAAGAFTNFLLGFVVMVILIAAQSNPSPAGSSTPSTMVPSAARRVWKQGIRCWPSMAAGALWRTTCSMS